MSLADDVLLVLLREGIVSLFEPLWMSVNRSHLLAGEDSDLQRDISSFSALKVGMKTHSPVLSFCSVTKNLGFSQRVGTLTRGRR